jgi:hypothetical protein
MSNGYNRDYLDIKVGKFLDNKIVAKENDSVYGPSQKKVYISLPYLAGGKTDRQHVSQQIKMWQVATILLSRNLPTLMSK